MSRIPGASPITDDIEAIRRSGDDKDRSLTGSDRDAIPEPAPSENESEQKQNISTGRRDDGGRGLA